MFALFAVPGPYKITIAKHSTIVNAGSAAEFDFHVTNQAEDYEAMFHIFINGMMNKTFTLKEEESRR